MKILWHSTKPNIPSGYGMQSDLIVTELVANGQDVEYSCSSGLWGVTEVIVRAGKKVRLLPHSAYPAKYGMDTLPLHFAQVKADFIWSFIDCFIFDPEVCKKIPWLAWVPVDSDPVMHKNIAPLKACRWLAAPTRWGTRMLKNRGLECSYLPCCYSPSQYRPMDREQARMTLSRLLKRDIPQDQLVNVISSNCGGRKNFPAIFEAWTIVHKERPDALLYIHADASGYFTSGEDLDPLFDLYEVDRESVIFAPSWQYVCGMIGTDYLNIVHNASAVHLNACYGEGFGLPILEAMAAGCPCVVPEFGGAFELVHDWQCGITVPGTMLNTVPGAKQMFVNPAALAKAILCVMAGPYNREYISESVRQYEARTVFREHVRPLLGRIAEELGCSPPC